MAKQSFIKKSIWLILLLFFVLNLISLFTPEIGFDALWYHLTLPKLFLFNGQWYFPGGLLYYSVMPRLAETFFIPLVKYTGYIGPKASQLLAGLGTCVIIYKLTKKFTNQRLIPWLAVILFYATWVVSWQSGSAYIDLIRAFFETSALYLLLNDSKYKRPWAGIFLGLAIGSKWLALGSLLIYSLYFGWQLLPVALFIALPWFLIAFHFTGNPVYPIFDSKLTAIFHLVFPLDDYLSPIMGLIFIFSFFMIFSQNQKIKKITQIGLTGTIFVLLTPQSSYRYLIPFLPAIVISGSLFVSKLKPSLQKPIFILSIFSSLIILSGRVYSLSKYTSFLLHKQTQNQFLASWANKLPDTFIDSDDFVIKNLKPSDRILIDSLHNLYYFPYNFDHTSWVNKSLWSGYDYLITTPKGDFRQGKLIHTNKIGIQIYNLKNW